MAAGAAASGAMAGQQNISAVNRQIRQMILKTALERKIQLPSPQISALQLSGGAPIAINPQPIGLVKKFVVEITGSANNTDGANVANLSDFGLANLLSQVVFEDTQGYTRIQTTGWHLDFLFRAKHRWGASRSLLAASIADTGNFGNNFAIITAPTGIAHGASANFRMVFEIPISYSDEDLRGAVYIGLVNAVSKLQLTLNAAPFAAAGVDSTLACWKGAGGNISNVAINIYQVFLDQLPRDKANNPVLPPLDKSTVYELKNTANSQAYQVGIDNPISYSNFRRFMSTFLVYNDNPAADAGRVGGTDVNYLALQSANVTNIKKVDPLELERESRILTMTDFPPGVYYWSHRKAPIDTLNYGNMQLILNPSAAAAGAYGYVGWEDFGALSVLQQAGSLAG
jgi:P3 major capsid protein